MPKYVNQLCLSPTLYVSTDHCIVPLDVVSVEKDVILVTSFLFPWEWILSYGNTLLVFYVRFTLLFFGFVLNPYQMYT